MEQKKEYYLKFGKYKGVPMKHVPIDYMKWLVDNNILKGSNLSHGKELLNYPKVKFKVTVEGAVQGDGSFVVEAYDKNQAIWELRKTNFIHISQSFSGTVFTVTKL